VREDDQRARSRYEVRAAGCNEGTATTSIPALGSIVLGFKLDSSGALTYTIQKKPFIVSESQISERDQRLDQRVPQVGPRAAAPSSKP